MLFELFFTNKSLFFSSFKKFDERLASVEDKIDEMLLDNEVQQKMDDNYAQQEEIQKEFLNQISKVKSDMQHMEILQKNFYSEIEKNKNIFEIPK